jgi:phosphoribosylaminoimidazolecarboxamide formyltransferase / IMP cyclohydrolase
MAMNIVEKIDDRVHVKHVLISVSDKSGLETFVPRLLTINPDMRILSTGGTFARLREILGSRADDCLMQVADYTGQPETQGGLVKTLDFKIYLGLLTETYNDAHRSDLQRTGAVPIDLVVVNLYPFRETVAKAGITPEQARGNIDIGGPCMIRAAAKNFIRVAAVVDPGDYGNIADEMTADDGSTSLALRYQLARKAFAHTAEYDTAVAGYLGAVDITTVQATYRRQDI